MISGRRLAAIVGSGLLVAVAGCHSAYIEARVRNDTPQPVSLIDVAYPSASFGRASLAAGAEFRYRFKVLGSGATKVTWTDSAHKEHSTAGPALHEGDEGQVAVVLGETAAGWTLTLKKL